MSKRTVVMPQNERNCVPKTSLIDVENNADGKLRRSVFERLGHSTSKVVNPVEYPNLNTEIKSTCYHVTCSQIIGKKSFSCDKPTASESSARRKGFRKTGPVFKETKKTRLIKFRMEESKFEKVRLKPQTCDCVLSAETEEKQSEPDTKIGTQRLKVNNELIHNVPKCDGSELNDNVSINGSKLYDELNTDGSKVDYELDIDGTKVDDDLNADESDVNDVLNGETDCLRDPLALYKLSDLDLIKYMDAFLEDMSSSETRRDEGTFDPESSSVESCDLISESLLDTDVRDITCAGSNGPSSHTGNDVDNNDSTNNLNMDGFESDGESVLPLVMCNGLDEDSYILNMLDAFLEQDGAETKTDQTVPPSLKRTSSMFDDTATKRTKPNSDDNCFPPSRKRKISPTRNQITSPEKITRIS